MTFDNHVVYYGDGQCGENKLQSDSLHDYNNLMKKGKIFGSDLSLREIHESLKSVKQYLSSS